MINSLCLYFKSCRMLIRSQMQYRASFLMQTFTQLVMMVTELLAVLILMDRFSVLGQWNRGEILFFFGVIFHIILPVRVLCARHHAVPAADCAGRSGQHAHPPARRAVSGYLAAAPIPAASAPF